LPKSAPSARRRSGQRLGSHATETGLRTRRSYTPLEHLADKRPVINILLNELAQRSCSFLVLRVGIHLLAGAQKAEPNLVAHGRGTVAAGNFSVLNCVSDRM
jgi:hypothetical protein